MGTSDIAGTRVFGRIGGLPNVVPFTYRDGATFADILYGVRDYLVNTMVPGFELDITELTEQLNSELGDMGSEIIAGQERAQGLHEAFTTEILRHIAEINNKTGVIDIQRITLTNSSTIIAIKPTWPNNHPVDFVLTQNSVGGHRVAFSSEIYTNPAMYIDPAPNAVTEITIYPDGKGRWEARPRVMSGDNDIQVMRLTAPVTTINVDPKWDKTQPVRFSITQDGNGGKSLIAGEGITGEIKVNPRQNTVTEVTLLPTGSGTWIVAPEYAQMNSGSNSTRLGKDALINANNNWARNNNAVGSGAMFNMRFGHYNDFFGLQAGYYLDGEGETGDFRIATRNSGFGSNTQRFNKTGFNNVSMGRNSLQNNVTGKSNTYIGAGSGAGLAPLGLDNVTIENQLPLTVNQNTAVGESTLRDSFGDNNTAVGYMAAFTTKKSDRNTAIGRQALGSLDIHTAYNGKIQTNVNWPVSFNFSSGEIVVTKAAHGLGIGYCVGIKFPHLTDMQNLYVKNVDRDVFTLERNGHTLDKTLNGSAQVSYYANTTDARTNSMNTAVGSSALSALEGDTEWGGCQFNTAIGFNAGSVNVDGTPTLTTANSAAIGANSKISGVNQMQLGNETQGVYTTQPIQVRSDRRDKADIEDTRLGLDFIEKLRPVDYRWDMRADYFEYDEEGAIVSVGERDGSKKRRRIHHGLIAQEVQSVIEETGVDFGGFQDHKVNGGSDVMTVGYEELIAPLIKAVQELSAQVKELKGK